MSVDRDGIEIIAKSTIKVIHGFTRAFHCRSNHLNFPLALFAKLVYRAHSTEPCPFLLNWFDSALDVDGIIMEPGIIKRHISRSCLDGRMSTCLSLFIS